MEVMKVRFQQSGGFAGLLRTCEIDTKDLHPEKAQELHELVKSSAIPEAGQFLSDSSRDLREYEISIDDGDSKSSVVFDDESLPQSAKPLIAYLKKCAKPDKV